MKIRILELIEGAKAARGLTVIIDVFRAMTVEAYVMQNGAARLCPVGDKEIAYEYRRKHPGTVLIGERGGVMLPGFDYGNSPSQVRNVDFTGKTVIHTTSAGTQGIACARDASEIITGALVNSRAIAEYIRRKDPEEVSLVCMGLDGITPTEEDTLCAEYIRSLLLSEPMDPSLSFDSLRKGSGAKFFDPGKQNVFPREDFFLSTETDRFDFVLRLEEDENEGLPVIRRVDVPQALPEK